MLHSYRVGEPYNPRLAAPPPPYPAGAFSRLLYIRTYSLSLLYVCTT